MKRFVIAFSALLVLVATSATSCKTPQSSQGYMHPDEVFTVSEEDIANETWRINSAISGEWTYKGPSVDVSGKNLLAGIGKPIAKGKLKKKLQKAYKTIGLDRARPQFTFSPDGSCAIRMMGVSLKGQYNYNPSTEQLTLKWHGIPMTAKLRRDGKRKLHITFDTDKLLSLLRLVGRFSDSSTIKALSFLTDHYDDVMVGFELKK
ncbi:MAG: DUF4923 family protein [Muribaculaceae bacterium]|nr:DUF4923 family protein [Muribaculaceae bacterium]